jgi:adenosylcobinamide amidohydrolase
LTGISDRLENLDLRNHAKPVVSQWEILHSDELISVRRQGRFVVADLLRPHRVLSTSVRHGGQADHIRHLVNHQSCEGSAHHDRHRMITESGLDGYHETVCSEAALPADDTAVMGTAANMNYLSIARAEDEGVSAMAAVTAGVEGNATTAGEPAVWREGASGIQRVPVYEGTINIMLFINRPLTAAALARVVVTMTEGKSAALQRLAVPSKRHADLATGTGTDQYCVAVPITGPNTLTSASPHMKLGELVGAVTRDATIEALRWQNGLEMSYTRGVFHALGRYGVKETTFFDDIAPLLDDGDLELLRKNAKAALFEPCVGAAAHALGVVSDRIRYGTLPRASAADALVQQAALLAANLAAQLHRFAEFRQSLGAYADQDTKTLTLRAFALGWSEKWRRL